MAEKGKQDGSEVRLTEKQKKLLKELRGQVESQRKEKDSTKKTLRLIIIIVLAVCIGLSFLKKPQVYPAEGELQVHFIDVGQGDCIYIAAGRQNMLIDCGESSSIDKVLSYLNGLGVTSLDYVIGTHPHSDHMGGMSSIVETYDIGEFIILHLADEDIPTASYFLKFLNAAEKYDVKLAEAETGREFTVGDAHCEIIAPNGEGYNDLNDYSVSVMLRHGENSFIFTGDAEAVSEKEMIASGRLTHADVYKAGHHGSNSSGHPEFLSIISPEIAVISCGAGNYYGHPKDATLERLSVYTDNIFRTDLCGNILIKSDGNELTVSTERSSR